jgi:hypothetical protein
MNLGKLLKKEQIREATKRALLTNTQGSSAMRSYRPSLHARVAWVAPMELPPAWE